MPEPLTIYECGVCGRISNARPVQHVTGCLGTAHAVRVFREEDVRPLWKVVTHGRHDLTVDEAAAIDAFPAPEEWRT